MAETLGVCVATRHNMRHVVGLSTAAKAAGKQVEILFTGEGVLLTQDPAFDALVQVAAVKVCEVSYLSFGFTDKEIHGLKDRDFVTQARNAEMAERCHRYVIL